MARRSPNPRHWPGGHASAFFSVALPVSVVSIRGQQSQFTALPRGTGLGGRGTLYKQSQSGGVSSLKLHVLSRRSSWSGAQRVCEKPVRRGGMAFQPMNHRQDADATQPHAQSLPPHKRGMRVPLLTFARRCRCTNRPNLECSAAMRGAPCTNKANSDQSPRRGKYLADNDL
jgi:hypothetical protein